MNSPKCDRSVPEIVRVVLSQLARLHAAREVSDAEFQSKIDRLVREELAPRNLYLLTRKLQDGTTRFIIRDQAHDTVCDLVDCRDSADENGDPISHAGERDGTVSAENFRQSAERA